MSDSAFAHPSEGMGERVRVCTWETGWKLRIVAAACACVCV